VPELDDLRLAVAAYDAENFGAVAREMHVSQSTVSRAVRRVEGSLGVELFRREGRSVSATSDSASIIDELRGLLDGWDAIVRASRTGQVSELSVFCTVTASQLIAPPLFEQFRRRCPDVHVDLRTGPAGSAIDAVRDGSVDTAIAPLPNRLPAGLVAVRLATTPFVAVAIRDVRTIGGQPMLLSRQGLLRELTERWVHRHLSPDTEIREAETNEEVLALAAMGSGVGLVPKLVVDASPLKSRVHEVAVPVALPIVTVGLVARRRAAAVRPLADLWALAST
jgi:LysR family transcriptional regulator, positive regulator for ilvC